ncbi:MAG TPA: DJ-1/PfpI family protein [Chthoniobacterales bacterium]|nr:DJ-1/PfpI family protein [Chthoniobacterales bacterium]
MTPRRIGIIGFDGASSVDLSGPAEAFSSVKLGENGCGRAGYEIVTLAASTRAFTSDSGLIFKPHTTFKDAPPLDTLIIPGGMGLCTPAVSEPITAFVRQSIDHTRRMVALGAGVYAVAATGLLDGQRVTTHWRHGRDLASRFPNLRIEENKLFVNDGPFYTSAGSAAGIDLALHLIEQDYGLLVSLEVARNLVVFLKRSGAQEQISESLQFQTTSISRLSDLSVWILSHLAEDLSVETLAARACLCPRQFGRRFKTEFGSTPADFVERARLEEAQRRLSFRNATVESVAMSVGFKSSDVFRRRFEHRFGVTPTEFKRRLGKFTGRTVEHRRKERWKPPLAA